MTKFTLGMRRTATVKALQVGLTRGPRIDDHDPGNGRMAGENNQKRRMTNGLRYFQDKDILGRDHCHHRRRELLFNRIMFTG